MKRALHCIKYKWFALSYTMRIVSIVLPPSLSMLFECPRHSESKIPFQIRMWKIKFEGDFSPAAPDEFFISCALRLFHCHTIKKWAEWHQVMPLYLLSWITQKSRLPSDCLTRVPRWPSFPMVLVHCVLACVCSNTHHHSFIMLTQTKRSQGAKKVIILHAE